MPSASDWLESLSPWPEEFGLGRMHALLAELGEPQRAFRAIHVVGTNGKSTATRRAAAFLLREGLSVGAYTSPHVAGWSERIQVDGEDADLEQALERVRPAAERVGRDAVRGADGSRARRVRGRGRRGRGRRGRPRRAARRDQRPRGGGGRADERRARPHRRARRDARGDRRGEAGRRRARLDRRARRARVGVTRARARRRPRSSIADDVGRAAAEAFLGRALEGDVEAHLPGRFDEVGDDVFAGAHNPAGVEWLLERLPRDDYVVVASILADKDAEAMLAAAVARGRHARRHRLAQRAGAAGGRAGAPAQGPSSSESSPSPTRPRRSSAGASWRASRAPCSSPARSICSPTSSSDFSAYHGEVRRAPERLRGCRRRRPDDRRPRVWRRVSGREAASLRRRAWA